MQNESRLAVGALLAGVLVVYLNALGGSFQFDDYNVIVHRPAVHSLEAWWTSMPGIRPLLKLSYTLNWMMDPGPGLFLAVNVVLHAVNAVLVFAIFRRLLDRMGMAEEAARIAFWVAAMFAVHPAQTEAVTYISGRSVSMMALFELGALYAWLKADGSSRALCWRGNSVLLLILALAVKENAWSLPFALLLCEALRPGWRWRSAMSRSAGHWLVLIVLAGVVVTVPGYWKLLEGSLATRTLWENLLTQVHGIFYLISVPLFSLQINIDPDLPAQVTWSAALAAKAVILAAVLALAVWQWRRRPWLGFGVLWFFVMLLPTNSILPRLDIANDRQLYLALIGPALIVCVVICRILTVRRMGRALAPLVLLLGVATVFRNADYETELLLWQDTAARSPRKARVFNNLGYAYQQAGRNDEARQAYLRALELDPAQDKARFNLEVLPPSR
ncbi:MAG: tetratricopeptide repeat protein [Burkholderiales bacterium]